ncbi:MAG: acetate--CoA ligase [Mariprofundaceae bacterium]
MSEAIQSNLRESRVFPPSANSDGANIDCMASYRSLCSRFSDDFEGTWRDIALANLLWKKPFTQVLNSKNAPFYRWFEDGSLNVSENCLDRHVTAGRGERTAIIWEGEPGEVRHISYSELLEQVNRAANAMLKSGVVEGDRVVIYMPMIPEAAVAMLACSRIGAIHSVVFGAFSAHSLKDRIEDAGAKLVITADGGWRKGSIHALKPNVDLALAEGCNSVRHVLLVRRCGNDVGWQDGRDLDWDDMLADQSSDCLPVALPAEQPLFILYTSGSTGKPKGIIHSSGGYLLWAMLTMKWVFDFKAGADVFWCTADIGWITGHTYSIYGPLACGGTTLMYEGVPTHPDPGRLWKICQEHAVSVFYTAPTAIRALIKAGDQWPAKYDLSCLRVLGTVGEPINPEAWIWYHQVIGAGKLPIVDTWWQTETGGHMIAPLPYAIPTKPGSATLPLPGIFADSVDSEGKSMPVDHGGNLVITRPWPSMLRGIWGDSERYVETYWKKYANHFYLAGDSCRRDEDGYYWIMGRVDDVLNVSGHRLGTMEVESALVSYGLVAESAVVGRPHDIKGEAISAFVVLKESHEDLNILAQQLRQQVSSEIGPIAKPDDIRFCIGLPKTRSGKIMRRLLRDVAAGREVQQDISTLEDQDVIIQIQDATPY